MIYGYQTIRLTPLILLYELINTKPMSSFPRYKKVMNIFQEIAFPKRIISTIQVLFSMMFNCIGFSHIFNFLFSFLENLKWPGFPIGSFCDWPKAMLTPTIVPRIIRTHDSGILWSKVQWNTSMSFLISEKKILKFTKS